MGKRFAILIGTAALGAALMAAGASADFRSVHDPTDVADPGDVRCGHETGQHGPCSASSKRNADIVRATAGHEGGRLRHTIRVVGKVQHVRLSISTDSDPSCEFLVEIQRGQGRPGKVRDVCDGGGSATGRARYDFHHHSVEIAFSERSIGNPRGYGWFVFATAGGCPDNDCNTMHDPSPHADDEAPNKGYIRHRLAQPAAAASAGVVRYNTELTIAKDRGGFFHGSVKSEVRKCERGRRVVLFKQRPGADRKLGTDRSHVGGGWGVTVPHGRLLHPGRADVYAKAKPKVRDRFVCRADRSPTI